MSPNLHKTSKSRRTGPAAFVADQERPLRGLFVHRMGENAADEQRVAEFWIAHGLNAMALEDPRQRYSRLPDLQLLRDGAPWAYCEVKTLWQHSWTVRILHEDRPIEERREMSTKPADERIGGDLVTAMRQLQAGNPGHVLHNFVVLVNREPMMTPAFLTELLTRPVAVSGRSLAARRAAQFAREFQAFRRDVDLCLLAKPRTGGKLVIESCILFNPGLRSFAEEISGLRGDKLVSVEPAA